MIFFIFILINFVYKKNAYKYKHYLFYVVLAFADFIKTTNPINDRQAHLTK